MTPKEIQRRLLLEADRWFRCKEMSRLLRCAAYEIQDMDRDMQDMRVELVEARSGERDLSDQLERVREVLKVKT